MQQGFSYKINFPFEIKVENMHLKLENNDFYYI